MAADSHFNSFVYRTVRSMLSPLNLVKDCTLKRLREIVVKSNSRRLVILGISSAAKIKCPLANTKRRVRVHNVPAELAASSASAFTRARCKLGGARLGSHHDCSNDIGKMYCWNTCDLTSMKLRPPSKCKYGYQTTPIRIPAMSKDRIRTGG